MTIARPLCLLALVLCPASAASAAEGFFGGVEALGLRPAGGSADYAVLDPDADLNLEGSVRSVELSTTFVPRVTVGWRWDTGWKMPAEIALSAWTFDADRRESIASGGGSLWDVLAPPNLSLGAYEGTAAATYGLDSRVVDLTYTQTVISDERAAVRVRIGLRHLEHESALRVTYAGPGRDVDVANVTETRATGLRAGVVGALPLGRRVRLEGELAYGLLRGTVTTHASALSLAAFPEIDLTIDRDRNITTLDGAVRLALDLGRGVSLQAAFEWARWADVEDAVTFVDDIQQAGFVVGHGDAVWQGVSLGAGWRW